MLEAESTWFSQEIKRIGYEEICPMCNIGSSTASFMREQQPWVFDYIFGPLQIAKCIVKHVDIKHAPGVDITGDLLEHRFLKELSSYNFKSIFFSNVLEHLVERELVCQSLISMIPAGGYIFVSCPKNYPFHPDPIDTMFRPSINQLAVLFKGTRLLSGEIVRGGNLITNERSVRKRVMIVARMMIPFYRLRNWVRNLHYLFSKYSATCIILYKPPNL